jgi:hypothetical protein
MDNSAAVLTDWTKERIDAECRPTYRRYEKELRAHYTRYFERHPQLRSARHPYSARTIAAALPPGYSDLRKRIPKGALHRFARSARSSQMLALALLGSAAERDSSLRWFWDALNLPKKFSGHRKPFIRFEHCLAPSDLGEVPRVTKLDFTVRTEKAFVVVETKLSEPGLGTCSCAREGDGDPRAGFDCAARVRSRKLYWKAAHEFLGLEEVRLSFLPCPLSVAYQVVRNIAAARHLSRGRLAAFVLICDEANPYFRQTGHWPGWPHILAEVLRKHSGIGFYFRAMSWQHLVKNLPLTPILREWAREKHKL